MNIFFKLCILLVSINFATAQTKRISKPTNAATSKSNLKVAYIYEDYILQNYDQVKRLEKLLEARKLVSQEEFNKLAAAYQASYADYQQSIKTLDSLTTEKLNEKVAKVQANKTAAEDFQRNAEKSLQEYTSEGIAQIKRGISIATNNIAKEKGYAYVFYRNKNETLMTGQKTVLYCSDKGQHNISDAILIALGSKPPLAQTAVKPAVEVKKK